MKKLLVLAAVVMALAGCAADVSTTAYLTVDASDSILPINGVFLNGDSIISSTIYPTKKSGEVEIDSGDGELSFIVPPGQHIVKMGACDFKPDAKYTLFITSKFLASAGTFMILADLERTD